MIRTNTRFRSVRWVLVGMRWVTPWLIRFVWFLSRQATAAGVAWFRFAPRAVRRIAYHWEQQAVNAGMPTEYEAWVYYGAAVITIWAALVGWVALAYLTVYFTTGLLELLGRLPLF